MPLDSQRKGAPGALHRRLLGCSADRTIALVQDAAGARLLKVFDTGSATDAERELRTAELLAGPGLVPCRRTVRDPWTDRPALEFDWVPGTDLGERIAQHGPFTAAAAARVARELATILARFASATGDGRRHGFVHGDVKPSNVLLGGDGEPASAPVYLLDLEHTAPAAPDREPQRGAFTGGTHGWAPPDAYEGAPPTAAFDVYGLGCCLRAMLAGIEPVPANGPPRFRAHALHGVPAPLRALAERCTAHAPQERPSWDEVIAALDAVLEDDGAPELDAARLAIAAAEFARAQQLLDVARANAARSDGVRGDRELARDVAALLRARRRAWTRVAPDGGGALDGEDLGELAQRATALSAVVRRFPALRAMRTRARQVLAAIGDGIANAPGRARQRAHDGDFEGARAVLEGAQRALDASAPLGRIPLPPGLDPVPPVRRDPTRLLALTRREVDLAAARTGELVARVAAAEGELDLDAARAAVDAVAAAHGGASAITQDLKERLHRLEFAIARIAGAQPALAECARQLQLAGLSIDLGPTVALVQRAGRTAREPRAEHCRALLRGLDELAADGARSERTVAPARGALFAALSALTDDAWRSLHEAAARLDATPIPIRPLQADLNRVDALDLAGCLVDQPHRSRAELLDALESVRMRLERARATRDRLARGAEEALDQGHLTTALFEMERAVNRFDDEAAKPEGASLADRFEHTKRLKHEIEAAERALHELAARYAQLATAATPEARIELLREREQKLAFLCRHVDADRRRRYEQDLAAVRLLLFQQADAAGRERFERSDERSRRGVAEQVAAELPVLIPQGGFGKAERDAVDAVLAAWKRRAEQPAARRARPRAQRALGTAAVIVLACALAFGVTELVRAAEPDLASLAAEAERIAEPERAAAARGLVALAGRPSADPAFLAELQRAVEGLDARLGDDAGAFSVRDLGRAVHVLACRGAVRAGVDRGALRAHFAATRALALAVPEPVERELAGVTAP